MAKSLRLSLYLATSARRDKPADASAGDAGRERLGHSSLQRPDGPLVWFHIGSDTQAIAVRELAQRVLSERDDLTFLITNDSPSRALTDTQVFSQFCPDDTLPAVRRFLDHWTPDLAIWTETDLRAALITETHARDIPMLLVDAKTARHKKGAGGWSGSYASELLRFFRLILAGDESASEELRRLGADMKAVEIGGFLQEGSPALPCNEGERDAFALRLGGRPTWLAAQVATDEFEAMLQAHKIAQHRSHRLLLILAPADPADSTAWAAQLTAEGYSIACRSQDQEPDADVQIYIADVPGEMGLWYRLAPISYLGSSLVKGAGVNPYGAAALGSAILNGPHTGTHAATYARLRAVGAARTVANGVDLGEAVLTLLSPAKAAEMAHHAWSVTSAGAEATDRITDLILTEIDHI